MPAPTSPSPPARSAGSRTNRKARCGDRLRRTGAIGVVVEIAMSGGGVDHIRAALQDHGLSDVAAQAAVRAGAALRARTEEHGAEFAAFLDADSGRRVGRVLGGTASEVDVGQLPRAMRAEREYVARHTHPNPASFTDADADADAALFLMFPRIRVAAVVGPAGTWHILSIASGQTRPNPVTVAQALHAELAALKPSYLARVQVGAMTGREALGELTHRAWIQVADRFELRYDRLGL